MEREYRVNSCGIYDCDPDWSWSSRGFKDFDLWAVFRGEGELVLNGKPHRVMAGSCFLIPPHTTVKGSHDENNRLLVYAAHFSARSPAHEIYEKRISHSAFFKELFSRVIRFYNMSRDDLAASCLDVLLNEFFSYPDAAGDSRECAARRRCISEICDRINTAPEEKHKLDALAREYGYSATYLGKLFHREVGVSFSDYLINARINYAKLLLLNTEMSSAQIAERLGYYDASHFINQFKSCVGCTPSEFR